VKAFSEFDPTVALRDGFLADLGGNILRALLSSELSIDDSEWEFADGATHFGYVERGHFNLLLPEDDETIVVGPGYYFAVPDGFEIAASLEPSMCLMVSRPDYRGFLHVGRIEREGRLRYIDGCTDSLLIPPIKLGDPCLNLLYFPPGIDQTMHTHPSERIGMILSGSGVCITPEGETPLEPGMLFCIHPNGRHKFRTDASDMRVLAYHPDSDFGPTDQDHPMINRTMVEGVSAKHLTTIHTS
jgi:quercetin dioxygenase-like cupin family protein